ncbi:NTP transferase domain-containing protein [Candidatus Gracilibacteria bacterium]|nr:NTP transferase domain-containing protein [Candidatus Gracilibacteria bacterium]MCF7856252.1 NTP transferase domain-containing protein [Candidatus Gracilibacteria bacterium]MCF7896269.1 NTP transferase domain-containing protein [Candidatus Gracilibacteria bacterium]
MKGVILAGGKGTRLLPLTKITNKHLLPIHDRPMIFYPLETLRQSGISEILIVTDGKFIAQFKKILNSSLQKKLKIKVLFAIQKKADGIAGALKLAEKFAAGEKIAVILGDNIFEANFREDAKIFRIGAKVFLKKVPDPERFGVAEIRGSQIVRIQEKPRRAKSDLAVVGLYFFDKRVFDIIRKIQPSKRGELEITAVNNFYLQTKSLNFTKIKGFWKDAGTFASLAEATKFIRENSKK